MYTCMSDMGIHSIITDLPLLAMKVVSEHMVENDVCTKVGEVSAFGILQGDSTASTTASD